MHPLSQKALASTLGLGWGGAMLVVGLVHWVVPSYGGAFLEVMSSLYPGYAPHGGLGSVLVGTVYGALDGAIGGCLLAWLHNRLM